MGLRALLAFHILCSLLLFAPPSAAQQPGATPALELQIVIFTMGPGDDTMAVAYTGDVSDGEIQSDFRSVAAALSAPNPEIKITRNPDSSGRIIPAAEAKLPGLTNWSTGAINLDPLIQTYRRFGHFRVNVMFFSGNFPLRDVTDFHRPPLRIKAERSENNVSYEIWVDQSSGVPERMPSVAGATRNVDWRRPLLGAVLIALVLGGGIFWITQIILAQRRAEPSRHERP